MTREEKVAQARAYFNRMTDVTKGVLTIKVVCAGTIRDHVESGITTWEELGFTDSDVESRIRLAQVWEAKTCFNWMADDSRGIYVIEELYAPLIRHYVASGITTWDELGFTDHDVEERLQQAKMWSESIV